MIFLRLVKQFALPTFLCAMGTACFVFAVEVQDKYSIQAPGSGIESLVPQNVIDVLLTTYSENEKVLIQDDLDNIKKMALRDKAVSSENDRIYVATAGGPGACKSTILETYLSDKQNFVYVDPDARALKFMTNTYHQSLIYYQISKNLPYRNLLENAYNKWRDASNYIANSVMNEAYAKGYNIAHGTTQTSPVISALLSKFKRKNYKVILLLCYAPDDVRVKTIEHRETVQAFVQSSTAGIVSKGKVFCQRFPTYFEYADEIHFYWTQDLEKWSVHAATYTKGKGLVVHDNDALDSFTQKYDADRKDSGSDLQLPSLHELMLLKPSQEHEKVAYPTTWINY